MRQTQFLVTIGSAKLFLFDGVTLTPVDLAEGRIVNTQICNNGAFFAVGVKSSQQSIFAVFRFEEG